MAKPEGKFSPEFIKLVREIERDLAKCLGALEGLRPAVDADWAYHNPGNVHDARNADFGYALEYTDMAAGYVAAWIKKLEAE
jgi:hypothetical protein